MLSSPLLSVLRSLLSRLIPADDQPGALEAGVENYLFRQWRGDCAAEFGALSLGLNQLNVEARSRVANHSFSELSPDQQDRLLADLESGRPKTTWPETIAASAFFERMVQLTHEGFYADPTNGGNPGAISWQMIGYDPRLPGTKPITE